MLQFSFTPVWLFPQLIFEKEGVYLHTNAKRSNQDTTLPGFIRIVERVSRSEGVEVDEIQKEIQKCTDHAVCFRPGCRP